jgi:hypothetical protein
MQLSYLYAVAISDGAVAEWTLSTLLPFVELPPLIGNMKLVQVASFMIFYKYVFIKVK